MRPIAMSVALAACVCCCLSAVGCTSPIRLPDQCATVRCGFPTQCRVLDGRSQCVHVPAVDPPRPRPRPPPIILNGTTRPVLTCATVLCIQGLVCKDIDGRPKCVNAGIKPPGTGGIKPPRPVCGDQVACTQVYQPVCGSDGETYGNACELNAKACERHDGLYKLADGPCQRPKPPPVKEPGCPQICPLIYSPVCGSDGRTYGNNCQMSVAACNQKKTITVARQGPCADAPQPPISPPTKNCSAACPKILRPVCGTDNKTYSNECLLNYARCSRNPKLQVKYEGECVFENDDDEQCGC